MDCGATCLRMIAKHHGKNYNLSDLRQASNTTREGTSLLGISSAAEKIGFRTLGVKTTFKQLVEDAPLPCVAHWNQNHFIVIHKIKGDYVHVADPGHGLITFPKDEFVKSWISSGNNEGILLEPVNNFV